MLLNKPELIAIEALSDDSIKIEDLLNPPEPYSVIYISTHSNQDWLAVEVFEDSLAGESKRDKRFTELVNRYGNYFNATHFHNSYAIGISPEGIKKLFNNPKSLVIVQGCSSENHARAFVSAGAAAAIGTKDNVSHNDAAFQLTHFRF